MQRLSQTSHSTGGGGGKGKFQALTSVIRLSRAGKKIAGSILVVAEDEKTRRLNKKNMRRTCTVADWMCLMDYPQEALPAWKT